MRGSPLSRAYRLALAMLPRSFRERHSAEIQRHFDKLLAENAGPYAAGKRFLILIRAVADVMWTAAVMRVDAVPDRSVPSDVGLSPQPEHTRMKGSLYRDVTYALRGLTRSPAFAIAAVMTLALGLGAATTIFSVVNGVLMRPLPYSSPGRLVNIWVDFGVGGQSLPAVSHRRLSRLQNASDALPGFRGGIRRRHDRRDGHSHWRQRGSRESRRQSRHIQFLSVARGQANPWPTIHERRRGVPRSARRDVEPRAVAASLWK
jgi:hypothetical protein